MKNLVMLASGKGSNAARIIEYLSSAGRPVNPLLISDRESSGIYALGEQYGVPTRHLPFDRMQSGELLETIRDHRADLVVLAGFLRMIPKEVVNEFGSRMINVHPSLLPKYGGKGMYGDHVHRAVIESGEDTSGITIHRVNERFDEGRVIAQFHCPVHADDSAEDLRARVQKLEHRYFSYVVETLLFGL
ncbi:MAG: phosphoribosylglycinamide formyltransferase [Flavobacteriales bacterium]|nr:phosphoribosylglycinamide formyltransferase [Flavobacteriales bacterium]